MFVKLLTGPMKAGKTKRLANDIEKYVLAKKNIVFVTPKMDTRKGSHNSYISKYLEELLKSEYVHVFETDDITKLKTYKSPLREDTAAIFVDEFFMLKGWSKEFFFEYGTGKYSKNIPLILAGITNSWNGDTFKATSIVYPFVDEIEREQAVCEKCGKPANYHFFNKGASKWNDDDSTIDDNCDKFTCMCMECYVKACKGKPISVDIKE